MKITPQGLGLLSFGAAVAGCLIMVIMFSMSCSPRPSSNTEGIRVGDCVEHVINPKMRGVILRTTNHSVSARSEDTERRRHWQYSEIRKIECPRGN